MGRSALTEDARVLEAPELVTRGDAWVLVTRVMVDVDGLCVISFCWTAEEAKELGHPHAAGKGAPKNLPALETRFSASKLGSGSLLPLLLELPTEDSNTHSLQEATGTCSADPGCCQSLPGSTQGWLPNYMLLQTAPEASRLHRRGEHR